MNRPDGKFGQFQCPDFFSRFLCKEFVFLFVIGITIIASIVHGLFISLLPALVAPYLGQIVIEGLPSLAAYTMTDVDCVSMSLFYSWLLKPLAGLIGM